eukprot:CAMPEP_0113317718 /NCGR_PEP_ID=MMETSP0010_2-20120614/12512_1 /TAXON_ID=216773 ORGANISM="Corethron hystrix, Strain 308" /NCGR_SAMPLE_ID=MMETSP0010_2 /ASSEMBLY_ACC=CAM_ASM_000155 /LENGTH=696 /DNA_ID=CAMNT_0000174751 /DNA_START=118 /DNA_END=2205 /DNA_ORIENTATION=+ /assembly_acc=CAM_ASM_000155
MLGRGFSADNGSFMATCVDAKSSGQTSFELDNYFVEINSRQTYTEDIAGKFQNSLVYSWATGQIEEEYLKADAENEAISASGIRRYPHFIISVFRIEKSSDSIDDSISGDLVEDSKDLLTRGEFVSFFQNCGPSFVRSISRAGELGVLFSYFSAEEEKSLNFSRKVEKVIKGFSTSTGGEESGDAQSSGQKAFDDLKNTNFYDSMTVKQRAIGIGNNLNSEGTVLVRSVIEVKNAMNFAYKSMQQEGSGIVFSIDYLQWSQSPMFQDAGNLDQQLIENVCTDNAGGEQVCVDRVLSSTTKRYNIGVNSEFIVRVEGIYEQKLNRNNNLQKCINKLEGMSEIELNSIAVNHVTSHTIIEITDAIEVMEGSQQTGVAVDADTIAIRLRRLKHLLMGSEEGTGAGATGLNTFFYQRMTQGLNDYIQNFYIECLDALRANDINFPGGSILSKDYSNIGVCSNPVCVSNVNVEWDTVQNSCRQTPNIDALERMWKLVYHYCPAKKDIHQTKYVNKELQRRSDLASESDSRSDTNRQFTPESINASKKVIQAKPMNLREDTSTGIKLRSGINKQPVELELPVQTLRSEMPENPVEAETIDNVESTSMDTQATETEVNVDPTYEPVVYEESEDGDEATETEVNVNLSDEQVEDEDSENGDKDTQTEVNVDPSDVPDQFVGSEFGDNDASRNLREDDDDWLANW